MSGIAERLARLTPKQRAAFELRLGRRLRDDSEGQIARLPRTEGLFPMLVAQRQLWLLDQVEGGSAFYNLAYCFRLRGPLSASALRRAFTAVARRHEPLRTAFCQVDSEPVQRVLPAAPVALPLVDLAMLPAAAALGEAERWAALDGRLPFDLARGRLLRCKLLRLAAAEHVLTITVHHIIADWESVKILLRELTALYGAFAAGQRTPPLPELPVQLVDFAAWQQKSSAAALAQQIAYWRRQLAGIPPLLALRTAAPRPLVQSFRGACLEFTLPEGLIADLRSWSRQVACTPFMTLLAAFQVLLAHLSGQHDIVVGTPVSYRSRPEIEKLIGFFINHLVLRVSLADDPPFARLVERVRGAVLDAYAHQDVPFDLLVEELAVARSLSFNPLIQVAFNYVADTADEELRIGDVAATPFGAQLETAQFDLTLVLMDGGSVVRGCLIYKRDLFTLPAVRWLRSQFESVLRAALAEAGVRAGELQRRLAAADEQRRREELRRVRAASYGKLRERQRPPARRQPAREMGEG